MWFERAQDAEISVKGKYQTKMLKNDKNDKNEKSDLREG